MTGTPMILLEGIAKTFDGPEGPVPVLKGIDLRIERGEIFGIIGRSGAGKSTLVRCINLLERPTAGRVRVAGTELTALPDNALRAARHRIGMIFQHFNLLSSRTVAGNIALPLEIAGRGRADIARTVTSLLDLVGLADKRNAWPAELSGGQKQRVGIARALASRPDVLLCDEATSALDPETTRSILSLLRDINCRLGLTIVLITHEMPVIKEICHRVAVIDGGAVVEQGTVFDVFTDPASEVTRAFVQDIVNRELPEGIAARLREGPPATGNPVLRITFTGAAANRPIMADLLRRHDIGFNILHGHIDYIQGAPFGTLTVEAWGGGRELQAAIDFIRANTLKVEILGRVAGHDRAVA
jgi:D-methionine transport system ATP-binding protein